MKKTLITLLALSGIALGATELRWNKSNTAGSDPLDVNLISVSDWDYFWNLYDPTGATRPEGTAGNAYAYGEDGDTESGVLKAITTVNNSDYYLTIGEGDHTIDVTKAVYFESLTSSASKLTLNFGTAGSITTAQQINTGSNATNVITLTATLTDKELLTLGSEDGVVTRTLLYGSSNNGIWNFADYGTKSLTISNLDSEYEFAGLIMADNLSTLKAGQYALVYNGPTAGGATNKVKPDWVQFVIKAAPVTPGDGVPEPTTATLSLLALAGLAARRRRR